MFINDSNIEYLTNLDNLTINHRLVLTPTILEGVYKIFANHLTMSYVQNDDYKINIQLLFTNDLVVDIVVDNDNILKIIYNNNEYDTINVVIDENLVYIRNTLIENDYDGKYDETFILTARDDSTIDLQSTNQQYTFSISTDITSTNVTSKAATKNITQKTSKGLNSNSSKALSKDVSNYITKDITFKASTIGLKITNVNDTNETYIIYDNGIKLGTFYIDFDDYSSSDYINKFFNCYSKNVSYNDVIKSLIYMDLGPIYKKHTEVKYTNVQMLTYEPCAGVLINNEYIECSKFIIRGSHLYLLFENDNNKYSKMIDVENKEFLIYPTIKFDTINLLDLKPFGYYKQNENGTYDYIENIETNIEALSIIVSKDNIKKVVLVRINTKDYGLMLYDESNYYLLYITKYGYISDIVYYKNIDELNIFNLSNYYTRHYDMKTKEYYSFPTPIYSLLGSEVYKYMISKLNTYISFSLNESDKLTDGNYIEIARNYYNSKYINYPIITTNENLIVNKQYKLIINNEKEYNGLLLKNETNKYTFCANDEISLDKNSKIILKLNDNIYSCSFQLD